MKKGFIADDAMSSDKRTRDVSSQFDLQDLNDTETSQERIHEWNASYVNGRTWIRDIQNSREQTYNDWWRERRNEFKWEKEYLINSRIDSALPDESIGNSSIPEYMVDFYDESALSPLWVELTDLEKKRILDMDLDVYNINK